MFVFHVRRSFNTIILSIFLNVALAMSSFMIEDYIHLEKSAKDRNL